MTQLDSQLEKKLISYLQANSAEDRGWVETTSQSGDTQRQLNTRLPLANHSSELASLAAYLKDNLGIDMVAQTDTLQAGQFYAVAPLSEGMAKMVSPGQMPYQLLFHADDKQRIDDFIAERASELGLDTQPASPAKRINTTTTGRTTS